MVLGFSLYGILISILLNLNINNKLLIILKNTFYLFALIIPFFFLTLSDSILFAPITIVLLFRFFQDNKPQMLMDFLLAFMCLAMFLESSFFWQFMIYVFISISIINSLNISKKNKALFFTNFSYNLVLLTVAKLLSISAGLFNDVNLILLYNILSYSSIIIFINKQLGVFSPARNIQNIESLNTLDYILYIVINIFFIPIIFLTVLKNLLFLNSEIFVGTMCLVSFVIIFTILVKKITKQFKKITDYSMAFYYLNFLIVTNAYFFIADFEIIELFLVMILNLVIHITIFFLERSKIVVKSTLLIFFILLQSPLLFTPLFFLYVKYNNILIAQNSILSSFVICCSLLLPYLLLDKSVLTISKNIENDIMS